MSFVSTLWPESANIESVANDRVADVNDDNDVHDDNDDGDDDNSNADDDEKLL